MELVPRVRDGRQIIERYAASGFRVSGAIYLGPVLVFPERTEAWADAAFTVDGLAPVLAHGGVELRGRTDAYRRRVPHVQYAGGRGPPRRRRAVADALSNRHDICSGTGTRREIARCRLTLVQLQPLFSASATMAGHRSTPERGGASSAGKRRTPAPGKRRRARSRWLGWHAPRNWVSAIGSTRRCCLTRDGGGRRYAAPGRQRRTASSPARRPKTHALISPPT
jgi:hypothetical protein